MNKTQSNPSTTSGYSEEEIINYTEEELKALDAPKLANTPPVTIAKAIEHLEVDQRRMVIRKLPTELASDVLAEMNPDHSAEVVGAMREWRAVEILEELNPDDAADVVEELDTEDRDRLLDKLEPETAEVVKTLMTYDPDTAGGIMTPDVATVQADMQIDSAIERLRTLNKELETLYYVYVIDADSRLQGVVSMRQMILAQPSQKICDIMITELNGVCTPEKDREEVAKAMANYNLIALPVVDEAQHLLGIVTHDDVIDILQKEATEDIQRLHGAGADESIHDTILSSVLKRHPWLLVNLFTALMAAGIVYLFRHQIENLSFLAVFMPIIASLGGNTGAQTLAVAIRGLALDEIRSRESAHICLKEALKGLVNGALIGLVAAFISYQITVNALFALAVFLAALLNMCLSGAIGAFIPLLLNKFKRDPAQSSHIFLTAITDVVGFFIFLSLGTWLLL